MTEEEINEYEQNKEYAEIKIPAFHPRLSRDQSLIEKKIAKYMLDNYGIDFANETHELHRSIDGTYCFGFVRFEKDGVKRQVNFTVSKGH